MKTIVVYTGDHDGRLAAFFAHQFFTENNKGETLDFREANYGSAFPLDADGVTAEDDVIILSFMGDREVYDAIAAKAKSMLFLSHMKSAVDKFDGATYASVDTEQSTALAAWEHFYPNKRPPKLAMLVSDRKLWKKKHVETPQMDAWLNYAQLGSDWEKWRELMEDFESYEIALKYGRLLLRNQERIIDAFIKASGSVLVQHGNLLKDHGDRNTTYAIYNNATPYASDTARAVMTEYNVDYTIDWHADMGRDVVVFDIRSNNPEKFSALEYAEKNGGGGQPEAAGFVMPLVEGMRLAAALGR
jgi:hypothetical protein